MHLTLFGGAVSVVEFPPQIPVLEIVSLAVSRLSFCSVAAALKAQREDRYHWIRATPLFSGEKGIVVRFLLGELFRQFENSASSAEIANIQAVDRLLP